MIEIYLHINYHWNSIFKCDEKKGHIPGTGVADYFVGKFVGTKILISGE